jgi:hypothetical protein
MKLGALLWVSVALLGCKRDTANDHGSGDPPRGTALGHERADCRPDKTCDPGLLCLSNLCVRPPPADCQIVADQLASMELGNYAEMEARAPIVANYKAACEKAYVSKEEGACFDTAKDKWSAAQCAPRMFPEMASSNTGDCARVADRVRALMAKQAVNITDPQMKAMYDGAVAVVQQSCEEDKWPDALKKCMIMAGDNGTDPVQQCTAQTPSGLQQKMQDRMMKLMQKIQR